MGHHQHRPRNHRLRTTAIPETAYAELAAEATRRWPAPWAQAIADSIVRRTVTATPVSEYLPDRLVAGRLVLVGDAAHVPTPMTGSGSATSLDDARVLAGTVSPSGNDGPDGLLAHQRQRREPARWLVRSGQRFSRTFGRWTHLAASPDPPPAREPSAMRSSVTSGRRAPWRRGFSWRSSAAGRGCSRTPRSTRRRCGR